jgi:exopolysaccharide biosynthesis polyprenyl glycosylphosphotransferase
LSNSSALGRAETADHILPSPARRDIDGSDRRRPVPGRPLAGRLPEQTARRAAEPLVPPGATPRLRPWTLLVELDALACALVALVSGSAIVLLCMLVANPVWRSVGLYSRRFRMSLLDDGPGLLGGVVCGVVVTGFVVSPPLVTSLVTGLQLLAFVLVGRSIGYVVMKRRRARSAVTYPAVILGEGPIAVLLAHRIQAHPETGLRLTGFLHDGAPGSPPLPAGRLGSTKDLSETVRLHGVTDVIVCDTGMTWQEQVDVLRTCSRLDVDIYVVPQLLEMHRLVDGTDQVWGLPLERVRHYTMSGFNWQVKRAMDVLGAGIGLALLAPVMAAVALAVRIDLGPGVIFHQERVGLDGRSFTVRKFRSMRDLPLDVVPPWFVSDDARLGHVGRFIRRFSLDELPQLVNVLFGDMSLVGPRPERPHFVEQFTAEVPGYTHRHRVPVGLTGLAAVEGLRGNTSIADRAYFDNFYIENWSLWLDMKVLLRTIAAVVKGTGR